MEPMFSKEHGIQLKIITPEKKINIYVKQTRPNLVPSNEEK
jgi:hypothetical protein